MMGLFWSGKSLQAVAEVKAELYRAAKIENCETICMRARTACAIESLFYGSHAGTE